MYYSIYSVRIIYTFNIETIYIYITLLHYINKKNSIRNNGVVEELKVYIPPFLVELYDKKGCFGFL
jgi:hypothetical protein